MWMFKLVSRVKSIATVAREVTNVHCPQLQVAEQDGQWATFVMEHLPDEDDADDLTHFNNRHALI